MVSALADKYVDSYIIVLIGSPAGARMARADLDL
jgi:hypothetical protein